MCQLFSSSKPNPNPKTKQEKVRLTSFHHKHFVPLASKQVASAAPNFPGSLIASINGFVVSTIVTFTPVLAFANASTRFVSTSLYCATALPSAATFSAPDARTVGVYWIGGTVRKTNERAPARLYRVCVWLMYWSRMLVRRVVG
jgi:hypothetical protein